MRTRIVTTARLLLFTSMASWLAGCTAVHSIAPVDASSVTYKSPAMSRTDLKESRLAVLPIAATERNEGFRRAAANELCGALERGGVAAEIVRPADVQGRLGEGGLASDVDGLLLGYERTGLVDKEALARLGEATGCRFLLTTRADSKATRDDYAAGAIHRASNVASASFRCRLWDAASGEVVWEGEGAAGALTNAPHYGTHAQVMTMAANGLATRLGKAPSDVPPPRNIDNLHDADQDQHRQRAAEGENAVAALNVFCAVFEVAGAIAEIAH